MAEILPLQVKTLINQSINQLLKTTMTIVTFSGMKHLF